jgi:sugar phosphate isomerase/epimerase
MYNFSACISDKITEDFEEKLNTCSQLLIPNIEIEEFNGKILSDLSGDELENYRNMLITHIKSIVLYSCSEPVENLEYYKLLFRKAHILNIKHIKVKKVDISSYSNNIEEFAQHLEKVVRISESFGIPLLCENNSSSVVAEDSNITKLFRLIKSNYLGLIFNPLEFVKLKKHPFFHVFYNSKIKNAIHFLRINDGLFRYGTSISPGEGNAEIKELASILLSRGFNGYFSFTPYLEQNDINTYRETIDRFKEMLIEM